MSSGKGGTLQHAAKIIRPGRTFLHRMYTTAFKVRELHYYTHLGKEFRSDLSWWHAFLDHWNGLSLMRYIKATIIPSKQTLLVHGAVEPSSKDIGFSEDGPLSGHP